MRTATCGMRAACKEKPHICKEITYVPRDRNLPTHSLIRFISSAHPIPRILAFSLWNSSSVRIPCARNSPSSLSWAYLSGVEEVGEATGVGRGSGAEAVRAAVGDIAASAASRPPNSLMRRDACSPAALIADMASRLSPIPFMRLATSLRSFPRSAPGEGVRQVPYPKGMQQEGSNL